MHGRPTISFLLLLLPLTISTLITLTTATPIETQQQQPTSAASSIAPVRTSFDDPGPLPPGQGFTRPPTKKAAMKRIPQKDTDPETLPAPIPDQSYADWMSNLYDMGSGSSRGGKKERRRSEESPRSRRGRERRDDARQYTTSVSAEEIDEWRMQAAGEGAVGRYIGDIDHDD